MSVATYAAAQLLRLLPRRRLSRAVGRLCDTSLPPRVSRVISGAYARLYDVDMMDVAPCASGYPSFDAFFTRQLRPGARTVSSDVLVSPADGALRAAGRIEPGARLVIKGRQYNVGELVGSDADATRYAGGSFAVVYLSPRDYHRVHSPVDGRLTLVRVMSGDRFPVNAVGERHVPRLLVVNERVALFIDSESLGRVALVMVGAMIVGRISVTALPGGCVDSGEYRVEPPRPLRRGDEVGIFHLGSTVVLLTEKSLVMSRGIGQIRYGESFSGGS